MARDTSSKLEQPTEPVQRRPTDALWFTILFGSIAIGIGMTVFAPVGDDPPAVTSTTIPFPTPATTTAEAGPTSTQPSPATTTAPAL